MTGPSTAGSIREVMMPMGTNPDEWIAAVASYVRNSFGNRSSLVTPADVARVRAATSSAQDDVDARGAGSFAAAAPGREPAWKLTASHNPATAAGGLTFTGLELAARRSSPACGSRSSCQRLFG